jgi:hypothetical protein
MPINLDPLLSEIQEYLEQCGIVVFKSFPRSGEPAAPVYWDTDRYPDYHQFLAAAQAAGARLVTLYAREFEEDMVDDALEQLEDAGLDREERRSFETRLKEIRAYSGFVCQIELSFDFAPRVYIFDLRTEWFDDLNDLIDRIEDSYRQQGEDDEPLRGYFSKN